MSYLIKDTTSKQRAEYVKKALSISLSGADKPSDEVMALALEYIEGKKELEEIQKLVVERYKNND